MDAIEALGSGVELVETRGQSEVLEPDPRRTNWEDAKPALRQLEEAWGTKVDPFVEDALAEAEEDVAKRIGDRLAVLMARRAVLTRLAFADETKFAQRISRAQKLADDPTLRLELEAATRSPDAFTSLTHAQWLLAADQRKRADRAAGEVKSQTREPALLAAAQRIRSAPRAVTSAPALFRFNGCGVGLYGSSDVWADGSYVATYCVCIAFIPVFPLTAYRVKRSGNYYQFAWQQPLGETGRRAQLGVFALAGLALAGFMVTQHFSGAAYHVEQDVAAAATLEQKGDREGALAAYNKTLETYAGKTDVDAAALGIVRLAGASLPNPCAASSVDAAGRFVAAVLEMPLAARTSEVAASASKKLVACAEQIGAQVSPQAATRVLDMAYSVAPEQERLGLDEQRISLRTSLAESLIATRPLAAIELYAKVATEHGPIAKAPDAIGLLGDAPSPWAYSEANLRALLPALPGELARTTGEKLTAMKVLQQHDVAIAEGNDEKAIAAAFARDPSHQELAMARARQLVNAGDDKGCVAALRTAARTSPLIPDAERMLAVCVARSEGVDKGISILRTLVEERLPALHDAERALERAAQSKQDELYKLTEREGDLPADIEAKLRAATKDQQPTIFREWVAQQLHTDPKVAELTEALEREDIAVEAAMSLGSLQLDRAMSASGEDRKRGLLEAEATFLSVHEAAEGAPGFHLNLGRIFYRLGKTKEADAELARLLERKDPTLSLAVFNVYRELDVTGKAREIAEAVYATGDDHIKKQAAMQRALVAESLEDERTWLERSATEVADVRANLLEVDASLLLQAGKVAEAEAKYASEIALRLKDDGPTSTSQNNIAVAYLNRFHASGDPAHLDEANKRLEKAARLAPDDPIVLHNLAAGLLHRAQIAVIDRWVKVRVLALSSEDAHRVIAALGEGALRDDVLKPVRESAKVHQAIEVERRRRSLSPGSADGYSIEMGLAGLTDDAVKIATLRSAIESVTILSDPRAKQDRESWLSGAKDAELSKLRSDAVTVAEGRLGRAKETNHAPTIAVAWMLLGDARYAAARLDGKTESFRSARDAYREATAKWPELSCQSPVQASLAMMAMAEGAKTSPALNEAWTSRARTQRASLIMFRAATGEHGNEVLSTLRASPSMREALELAKATPEQRPDVADWAFAFVLGDPEVETRARKAFDREINRDALKIGQMFDPDDPDTVEMAAVFAARGVPPRLATDRLGHEPWRGGREPTIAVPGNVLRCGDVDRVYRLPRVS